MRDEKSGSNRLFRESWKSVAQSATSVLRQLNELKGWDDWSTGNIERKANKQAKHRQCETSVGESFVTK